MKLFKKALVATAIVGAFGAQAADVSDATKLTSLEGFTVNGVTGQPSVRTIVREQLEAGDQITLTFGAGFDLSGVANVTVGQDPITVAAGDIGINTGTGTYEVEYLPAESDLANGVVVLEVKTGFTIEKDESFEIVADAGVFKSTATTANSTVTYSAAAWQDGSPKDTSGDNTGTFLRLASQYAAMVKSELDGVIERENQLTFISGQSDAGTAAGDNEADTVTFAVTDRQDYTGAIASTDVAATFKIAGDFSDVVSGDLSVTATGDIAVADLSAVVDSDEKGITVTLIDDTTTPDGLAGTFTVEIDNATRVGIPETIKATDFVVDASVDYDGAGTATDKVVLTKADAGEWMLDATLINVPYFPVGFEGLDTSIHFANESSSDVDVIITAIDDAGNEYTSMGATIELAADTVTKYRQDQIQAWLKDEDGNPVADKTKLSVTFNIDADDGDVNAYAFSNAKAAGARQSLVTSQQKGK